MLLGSHRLASWLVSPTRSWGSMEGPVSLLLGRTEYGTYSTDPQVYARTQSLGRRSWLRDDETANCLILLDCVMRGERCGQGGKKRSASPFLCPSLGCHSLLPFLPVITARPAHNPFAPSLFPNLCPLSQQDCVIRWFFVLRSFMPVLFCFCSPLRGPPQPLVDISQDGEAIINAVAIGRPRSGGATNQSRVGRRP